MAVASNRASIVAVCAVVVLGLAAVRAVQKEPLEQSRVVFENDKVRVTQFTSEPGGGVCGLGEHSHLAHLTVALSPARNHVVTPDGKVTDRTLQFGDVFWSDAGTHSAVNGGASTTRLLIVEIK